MELNPERAFIAAIIAEPAEGFEVIDRTGLTAEDFRALETRALISELFKMRDDGERINEITLSNRLPQRYRNTPFEIGGECGYQTPGYWAGFILKSSQRARVAIIAETLKRAADNPEADLEQALDQALLGISKTQDKGLVSKSQTLKEVYADIIADLDNPPRFIPTPWEALNQALIGLRPGALYVIGARPGVGKSLIGLQLAQGIATPDCQVAYFSFEMANPELGNRALNASTGIPAEAITKKQLTPAQREAIIQEHQRASTALHLLGEPSRLVTQLRPQLRAINSETGGKLGAVVVDYLQLMEAKGANRIEQVSAISGQLKSLAMELDIPIIALAQLNRDTEKADGLPELHNLGGSTSIEQDADAVIFLARNPKNKTEVFLYLAKHRQGKLGLFLGQIDQRTLTLKGLKDIKGN